MKKKKEKLEIEMVRIDSYGNFRVCINGVFYLGKLPSGYTWWDRISKIKNKKNLLKELQKQGNLKRELLKFEQLEFELDRI